MYEVKETLKERVETKMKNFAGIDRGEEEREHHFMSSTQKTWDKCKPYTFGMRRMFPTLDEQLNSK